MPDIEAVAEPSPVAARTLAEPAPVDDWLLLEWVDDAGCTGGGFWTCGLLHKSRQVALSYSIRDPRRERIVHIVEPRG